MIPANPGFTYIELWWSDDGKLHLGEIHPVIGWTPVSSDGWPGSELSMLPVMVVKRMSDEEPWAVRYPDRGKVVDADGIVHDSIDNWMVLVRERRARLEMIAAEREAREREARKAAEVAKAAEDLNTEATHPH